MLKIETGENNRILRTPSSEISEINEDIKKFILEMKETLKDTPSGVALAAPQVGKNLRIFVVSEKVSLKTIFINPKIIKKSEKENLLEEGCLSLPGIIGKIKRNKWTKIEAIDEKGKKFRLKAEDLLAEIMQHEIDHLDGVLFIDKAASKFCFEKT